ncbi:MAG: VOC family protein [Acidobacteriota bacterium]|nr:VOC family protein [Acidobacteriota bacterium]
MDFTLKTKISTPRLAETLDFYKTVFGMVVVEEWDAPDDKGVILALGNGRNEAFLEIYDTAVEHDFSGLSLQFKTDDLNAFIRSLPDGIENDGPKLRPWGSTYLYLRDPNKILVIVYEGGL